MVPLQISNEIDRILTISLLLKKIEKNTKIQKYLPDEPAKHITKEFLLGVLNTLSPDFMHKVIGEVEEHLAKNKKQKPPNEIQIDTGMLELLRKYC